MISSVLDLWRRSAVRGLKLASVLLVGAVLLMSTAFLAGRPSVFFDTDGYYLMGENLTQVIKSLPEAIKSRGASLRVPVSDDDQIDIAIMGARSPYYGFLLYLTDKIGGTWLLAMHGPNGVDYISTSIYVEVVTPERLVLDHISPPFRKVVTFKEVGNKTEITVRTIFESVALLEREIARVGADKGLQETLDCLGEYLSTL